MKALHDVVRQSRATQRHRREQCQSANLRAEPSCHQFGDLRTHAMPDENHGPFQRTHAHSHIVGEAIETIGTVLVRAVAHSRQIHAYGIGPSFAEGSDDLSPGDRSVQKAVYENRHNTA
jgi:hypothetical protein